MHIFLHIYLHILHTDEPFTYYPYYPYYLAYYMTYYISYSAYSKYYIFRRLYIIHILHILHMNDKKVLASGVLFFAWPMLIAWSPIPPPTSVTAALCLITTCAQKVSRFPSHLDGDRSSIAHRNKKKSPQYGGHWNNIQDLS